MPTSRGATGVSGGEQGSDRTLIISSDGHAIAEMDAYRPYLPARLHEEFDAFCEFYREHGVRTSDPRSLANRTDAYIVEQWKAQVIDTGRLEGISDPNARIEEQDRNGFAAEVIFPDFGLPFQVGAIATSRELGHTRTPEQIFEGNRAYNRWLLDFCSIAPHRFAPMACVSFDDVDAAVSDIRWAKEVGLKGVLLPQFSDDVPVYDLRFEPIWNIVEELDIPINSHIGTSSTTTRLGPNPSARAALPSATAIGSLFSTFHSRQLLRHMIWGGVLERHPGMKVVFSELGSGWVVDELMDMDYDYEGSYLRSDVRELLSVKPSAYFARQCSLGSSVFTRAEIEARHLIGLEKMALGFDYPHHEGAWAAGPGPVAYLRATLGAAHVPEDEAQMLLSQNAADLWGFDLGALRGVADRIGPSLEEILTPPTVDEYPRGIVHRPLAITAR